MSEKKFGGFDPEEEGQLSFEDWARKMLSNQNLPFTRENIESLLDTLEKIYITGKSWLDFSTLIGEETRVAEIIVSEPTGPNEDNRKLYDDSLQ